jgi:hypothetical protein
VKVFKLVILLFCLTVKLAAQPAGKVSPGTSPVPAKKVGAAGIQMVTATDHDTCLGKRFSVVFYLVQNTAGTLTTTHANALGTQITGILNSVFERICVSFQSCSTVVIPNHAYNEWNPGIVDQVVTNNWFTPKTISIYLVEKIEPFYGLEKLGYAHAPNVPGALNSSKDVLVIQYKGELHALMGNDAGFIGSTVVHIMGHFFGLADTFLEIGNPVVPAPPNGIIQSYEFVDRSNCYSNGDGCCDTEADPYFLSYYDMLPPMGTYCGFHPVIKDGKGQVYTPPVDNFMSMYHCRCRFTQEQYNKMARYILKNRMYLH